jgi:hypothetical protein
MKKRYNKLVAYLLMDLSTVGVGAIITGFVMLFKADSAVISIFLIGLFCMAITALLTLYINSRTPKGERVSTWFRAWWLGFRIALKMALCCTLILIPLMLKWSIDYSKCDIIDTSEKPENWYDKRKYVYDDDGNKYEVGRSGEYVKDKHGNWQRAHRDDDGNPYLGDDGIIINNRTYLK